MGFGMARHAFVAAPVHDRNFDMFTVAMLVRETKLFCERGWDLTFAGHAGSHALHLARNAIIHKFLSDPQYTDLFMLDRDISADPGAMVRFMDHPVDLVSGVYLQKHDPPVFQIRPFEEGGGFERDPEHGLVKHGGHGLGFTRASRYACKRIVDFISHEMPDSWYGDPLLPGERVWPVCQMGFATNLPINEDMWFFAAAKSAGLVPWADPDLTLCHAGNKDFVGNFAETARLGRPKRLAA